MTPNIKVHTDFSDRRPTMVRFYIENSDNNVSFHAGVEVGNWLIENKIEHTIVAFSDVRISALIPSKEARVLLRLTFDMYVEVFYDEDEAWF